MRTKPEKTNFFIPYPLEVLVCGIEKLQVGCQHGKARYFKAIGNWGCPANERIPARRVISDRVTRGTGSVLLNDIEAVNVCQE
jgi:hypothetical protein